MCHSDRPSGGSPPGAARPARPLPDLCPTSRAAPLCAVPDLPDLFLARVYMQSSRAPFLHPYICAYRSGRLGRSGKASHGAGFDCPTSPHVGRAEHERSGRPRDWPSAAGLGCQPAMRTQSAVRCRREMLRKTERRSAFVHNSEMLRKAERRSAYLNIYLTYRSGSSLDWPSAGSTAAIQRKFQAVNFGSTGVAAVQLGGSVGGAACRS
jgi:hypothetical protein